MKLCDNSSILAFGWLGTLNLLGTINPATGADGIRLRCGNILLGNKDTLSNLFKETRFNHYLIGELHIVDKNLTPNSRRDDFEDSEVKGQLLTEFLKVIGIPLSKMIRDVSKQRGKSNSNNATQTLFEQATTIIQNGYLSTRQKDKIVNHLDNVNGSHSVEEVQLAKQLSQQVSAAKDIISKRMVSIHSKSEILSVLQATLDEIYMDLPSSLLADKLTEKLYKVILNYTYNIGECSDSKHLETT